MTSDKPDNDGRNSDGTFAAGNSLGGSKTGSRHRVTRAIEILLEGQHELLTAKAVELALEGDTIALRLCLDRLAPPKRDSTVNIALPLVRSAKDAVEASSEVLSAVAEGEITPDQAGRVMALLSAHIGILEAGDHEQRIAALESRIRDEALGVQA